MGYRCFNKFNFILLIHFVWNSIHVAQTASSSKICWDGTWFNESSPVTNNRSDYEHQSTKVLTSICSSGSVKSAQCQDEKGEPFTDFKNDTSSMYIATCNAVTGLICHPYNNSQGVCPDFAIRYGCECPTTIAARTSNVATITTNNGRTTFSATRVTSSNKVVSSTSAGLQGQGHGRNGHGRSTENGCDKLTNSYFIVLMTVLMIVLML